MRTTIKNPKPPVADAHATGDEAPGVAGVGPGADGRDVQPQLGKWMPVRVTLRSKYNEYLLPKLAYIDRLRNGLILAYPVKIYTIPAELSFVIDPELIKTPLKNINKYSIIELDSDFEALARITVRETKKPLTEIYSWSTRVLSIEMLKPREPLRRYDRLVIVSLPVKAVGSGAIRNVEVADESAKHVIWRTRNSSPTGNHAILYLVFLAPPNERIKINYQWHGAKRPLVDETLEL